MAIGEWQATHLHCRFKVHGLLNRWLLWYKQKLTISSASRLTAIGISMCTGGWRNNDWGQVLHLIIYDEPWPNCHIKFRYSHIHPSLWGYWAILRMSTQCQPLHCLLLNFTPAPDSIPGVPHLVFLWDGRQVHLLSWQVHSLSRAKHASILNNYKQNQQRRVTVQSMQTSGGVQLIKRDSHKLFLKQWYSVTLNIILSSTRTLKLRKVFH